MKKEKKVTKYSKAMSDKSVRYLGGRKKTAKKPTKKGKK